MGLHWFLKCFLVYSRGSQPGVHVPLGVHLPIRRVHLRIAIEEKYVFTHLLFPNIYTYISEYYFQKPLYAYF